MHVKEAMSRTVQWIGPETSLADVAKKMREFDVGSLPVGENDRLVGMITDRDIVCRALAMGRDVARTTARDIMTPGVAYCFDDQDITEAAHIMEQKQLHRLPVLNKKKRMVGILSLGDLGRSCEHDLSGGVLQAVSRA